MDDEILCAVDAQMPSYNRKLILDFPREQVDRIVEILEMTFKEAFKFLHNVATLESVRVLTPRERIQVDIGGPKSTAASTALSEMTMVAFTIVHNKRRYESIVEVPYLVDGTVISRGSKYAFLFNIMEQVFSISENTMTARVIRQPLRFTRDQYITLKSATSDFTCTEPIVEAQLHSKMNRNVSPSTIANYLLCKFGLRGTLARFGLSDDDISFVENCGDDTDAYEYFVLKKPKVKDSTTLYMKVSKDALTDMTSRKLAANIFQVICRWTTYTLDDIYSKTCDMYLISLGETLTSSGGRSMAFSQAEANLYSVSFFLEPHSNNRFAKFGVEVDTIWDLLQYVFTEGDRILVGAVPQNLYNRRISIIDQFVIEKFVQRIYSLVYHLDQTTSVIGPREIAKLTRIQSRRASPIVVKARANASRRINLESAGNATSNGNVLLGVALHYHHATGGGAGKSPSLRSPEARFDPSHGAVTSLTAFPGDSPLTKGAINPFLEIDEHGGIIEPSYADELEKLRPKLPY